jgi:hypothetical protein
MEKDYETLAVERVESAKSAMGDNRSHLLAEAQVWATLALARAIAQRDGAAPDKPTS